MKSISYLSILIFIALLFQACAKPNYQDASPTASGSPGNNNTSTPVTDKPQQQNCSLYLSKSEICLHIQWLQNPNSLNNSSFVLTFTQGKTSTAVSSEVFEKLYTNLKIILWMPSMGHGSVPVIIKKNADALSLTVERVYFIMPGDWDIRFQIKENESIIDETRLSLFI